MRAEDPGEPKIRGEELECFALRVRWSKGLEAFTVFGQNSGLKAVMAKTSPGQFVRQIRQEISKVTWPTRKETVVSTAMVFLMAVVASLFLFGVDQLLAWAVRLVFGLGS